MKNITVRDIPPELADALDKERRRRGKSLNKTVIQLLGQGLGVPVTAPRSNGIARLAGSWTLEEHRQFEEAVAPSEQIDPELWR